MSHACLIHSCFISINPQESWAGISARGGYKQDLFCKWKGHAKRKKGFNQASELDTDGSELDFSAKEGL